MVIATEWKEFKDIDWETVYKGMKKPAFVFDGRLLVDAEELTKIGFKVCVSLSLFLLSCSNRTKFCVGRNHWSGQSLECFNSLEDRKHIDSRADIIYNRFKDLGIDCTVPECTFLLLL